MVSSERSEVVEQLGLCREVLWPVVALGERVAVQVAGDVDPAAWIGVLQPRSADVGVLLEHHGIDTDLPETMRGQQARHSGTDHGDAEVATWRDLGRAPRRCPQIRTRVAELFQEKLDVVVGGLGRHHPRHDRPDGVGGRLRCCRPTGVAEADQCLEGDRSRVRLLVEGPTALWFVVLGAIEVELRPGEIWRGAHVGQRCQ